MTRRLFAASLLALLVPVLARAQAEAVAGPAISFTKEFPNSQPDYISITLRESGAAEFRMAPNEKPVLSQLSPESTAQIFELARKLSLFEGVTIESGKKVAQMGKKTFAYENGAERNAVSFNHTESADALTLTSLFERLSNTQQHRDRLEYLLRFDRLGVTKELLQLEIDLNQDRLLEPSLLLPVLEKIQRDRSLVNVAHARAAQVVAKIRSAN
jgi:hypothetical protein